MKTGFAILFLAFSNLVFAQDGHPKITSQEVFNTARANIKKLATTDPEAIVVKKPTVAAWDLQEKHIAVLQEMIDIAFQARMTEVEKAWIRELIIEDFKKNPGPGASSIAAAAESWIFRIKTFKNFDQRQKASSIEGEMSLGRRNGWHFAMVVDQIAERRKTTVKVAKARPSDKFGAVGAKLDQDASEADFGVSAELFVKMALNSPKYANKVTPQSIGMIEERLERDFDKMPGDMQTFIANGEKIYDGFREQYDQMDDGKAATIASGFVQVLDALGLFGEGESSGGGGGGESSGSSSSDSDWETKSGLVMNTCWNLAQKSSGGW